MAIRLAPLDERVAAIAAAAFTVGVLLGPGERPWINGIVAVIFLALAFRRTTKAPRRVIAATIGMFFAGLFTVFAHHGLDPRLEVNSAPTVIRAQLVEAPVRAAHTRGWTVRVTEGPPKLRGRRLVLSSSTTESLAWGDAATMQVKLRPRPEAVAPKFRLTTPALRRGAVAYGTVMELRQTKASSGELAGSGPPATRLSTLLGDEGGGPILARWSKAGLHPWFEFEAVLLLALVAGFWLLGRLKSEQLAAHMALAAAVALIISLGPNPSRLRIGFVLLCVLGPRTLGKKLPVLLSLSGSVVLVLLANPYALSDVGFQLGFTALVGATRLAPALQRARPWSLHRGLKPTLWLLAILAAMTPLTARLFDQIGLATALGSAALLMLTLVAAVPWMTDQIFGLNVSGIWIEGCLAAIENMAASVHVAVGPIWTPSVLECVLMYGLLTVAATPRGRGFKQVSRLHASLALVFTWVVVVAAGQWTTRVRGDAQLVFLAEPSQGVIAQGGEQLVVLAQRRAAPWYVAEERQLTNELKRRRRLVIDSVVTYQAHPPIALAFVVRQLKLHSEPRPQHIALGEQEYAVPPVSGVSSVVDYEEGRATRRTLAP